MIESQKGIITIQLCTIENQKGAIARYRVYGDNTLLEKGTITNSVPLTTKRVLSLYKVYGDSALLVPNQTLII